MTMTKKKDLDLGPEVEPEARRLRRELFDEDMLDKLMAATDERGVALTGEGGFLPEMIKAVLERGMQVELADHLGYEKGDRAGHGSGNSRNGTTPKTVGTEVGDVTLDQPRGCQMVCVSGGFLDLKELDCEHDRARGRGWHDEGVGG